MHRSIRPQSKASLSFRTSARNALRGVVTSIVYGPISAEIGLLVNDRLVIDAVVTNSSADMLGLHPGGSAIALIKSTFVTLMHDVPGLRLSARNQIGGTISRMVEGPVETEVVLDIGGGAEIAAIVTSSSVRDLDLAVGLPILAFVKASHIILAVED
ncbi:ModE family transcriptional regulator [Novosphingobium sp. Rr 2-17]|uniref:TOBE domain-containing protein n=1 Tax=Novosphingobium sp. Rr 2-17 TaxID=555793 RepID=UPI000269A7FD|nr:TOBE domain-containing protein [Novosphingobium sp. Rr 2-17]EIZ79694.1 ModE family transcriptional regulator [Novosphingobium sp. Rr 2-17]